tara:strand:+ start:1594 stop:2031 length:438 start_codon:yes stop_codon:yes gene_type:complete
VNNKDVLISVIESMLNTPYKWGGDNPINGYDCSGLVQDTLCAVGLDPIGDQTANGLMNYYLKNGVEITEPEFGSVLFFGKKPDRATHISIGLNQRSMFEAGGGGRLTNTLEDAISRNAFCRIRAIKRRVDLIKIIKLDIDWSASC